MRSRSLAAYPVKNRLFCRWGGLIDLASRRKVAACGARMATKTPTCSSRKDKQQSIAVRRLPLCRETGLGVRGHIGEAGAWQTPAAAADAGAHGGDSASGADHRSPSSAAVTRPRRPPERPGRTRPPQRARRSGRRAPRAGRTKRPLPRCRWSGAGRTNRYGEDGPSRSFLTRARSSSPRRPTIGGCPDSPMRVRRCTFSSPIR